MIQDLLNYIIDTKDMTLTLIQVTTFYFTLPFDWENFFILHRSLPLRSYTLNPDLLNTTTRARGTRRKMNEWDSHTFFVISVTIPRKTGPPKKVSEPSDFCILKPVYGHFLRIPWFLDTG